MKLNYLNHRILRIRGVSRNALYKCTILYFSAKQSQTTASYKIQTVQKRSVKLTGDTFPPGCFVWFVCRWKSQRTECTVEPCNRPDTRHTHTYLVINAQLCHATALRLDIHTHTSSLMHSFYRNFSSLSSFFWLTIQCRHQTLDYGTCIQQN